MKKRASLGRQTKKTDWEYFDNCLICQEMKKADGEGRSLRAEELTDVFRKANEQN